MTHVIVTPDASGRDCSPELDAFLKYLVSHEVHSEFVRKVHKAVNHAKLRKEWSVEYMTLQEKLDIEREEGREEGKADGRISMCIELVRDGIITPTDAADRCGITETEFLALMKTNVSH